MELTRLHNGCLRIWLTETDLERMGLSFDRLDASDPTTRLAMGQILLAAEQQTGFIPSGNLMVEALPIQNGCLLLLSPIGDSQSWKPKRAGGPYIYAVETAEQLLRLAENWKRFAVREELLPASSLYRWDTHYRLIVYPAASFPPGMRQLLTEFTTETGEGDAAAAFIAEHGKALLIGNALPRLSAALHS